MFLDTWFDQIRNIPKFSHSRSFTFWSQLPGGANSYTIASVWLRGVGLCGAALHGISIKHMSNQDMSFGWAVAGVAVFWVLAISVIFFFFCRREQNLSKEEERTLLKQLRTRRNGQKRFSSSSPQALRSVASNNSLVNFKLRSCEPPA